jgi:hypothetical protein
MRHKQRVKELQILMSALANGLSCLTIDSVPDLVSRRVWPDILNVSGGLVLYDGLEDIRANFKSNEEDTGGDVVSEGVRAILETPPVMGMFPDILEMDCIDDGHDVMIFSSRSTDSFMDRPERPFQHVSRPDKYLGQPVVPWPFSQAWIHAVWT